MPTVTETQIDAYASCKDGRCAGYKQEAVKGIRSVIEFTYFDNGGDIPGVERSTEQIKFVDLADTQCPVCGEPRLIADQVRPIYPNVSGVPQDKILMIGSDSERLRDLQLADAKREAEMAQMRVLMERQAALIERLTAQTEPAPAPRGPGRPRKVVDDPQA